MKKALTLLMLRLLSSKAHGCKDFGKLSRPCHVGIHWIVLKECSQMSSHFPGFQSFFRFLHHFVLNKLATTSIRVKHKPFLSPFMKPAQGESSPRRDVLLSAHSKQGLILNLPGGIHVKLAAASSSLITSQKSALKIRTSHT